MSRRVLDDDLITWLRKRPDVIKMVMDARAMEQDGCTCRGHRHSGGVGGCYLTGCACRWRPD